MLRSRWREFLNRFSQRDADLDREIQSHLDLEAEDQATLSTARGDVDAGSHAAARRAFGNTPRVKEDVREVWGFTWLERLLQDSRYGLRQLRKDPGFAAVVILTIALGIGSTTAIFSLVNAVLIRSLPYGDPARLVYILTPNARFPQIPVGAWSPSYADALDFERETKSFSRMAIFNIESFSLTNGVSADRVTGARVSGDFFTTLEASPLFGRPITSGDAQPGHEQVALISYQIWQSKFGGDPAVLTKSVMLNGKSFQIIGVMPPLFRFPRASDAPDGGKPSIATDVWLPFALTPEERADRDNSSANLIARLGPGVSTAQARAELSAMMPRIDQLHNAGLRGWSVTTVPFLDAVIGDVRPLMGLLLGAVAMVLLIACGNTANLLLARSAARSREISVRAALGAGRTRLIRQLLTEALLLAAVGGALGVLFAYVGIRLLLRLDPGNIPRLGETVLDSRVLLFTLAVSVLTGLAFGILPAFAASKVNLVDALNQAATRITSGSARRVRAGLIVAEVALAVILLTGAGLLLRSYAKLQSVDPGFSASTITFEVQLDARYTKREQRLGFYRSLLERINRLPGVVSCGAVNYLPFGGGDSMTLFSVEAYPNQKDQLVNSRAVTPDYFASIGTPLIDGRFFTDADSVANPSPSPSSPVAPSVVIVNQAFADIYYTGRKPLGQHFRYRDFDADKNPWSTVVGVVANTRHETMEEQPHPQVYTPLWQGDTDRAFFVIRSAGAPGATPGNQLAALAPALRGAVAAVDPTVAAANIRTMDDRVFEANARRRFQTSLLSIFAASALVLSLIGLHGLMAYMVRRRTAEIGVRMALGATRSAVVQMVLANGISLVVMGLAVGIIGAFALRQLLSAWLYGVAPTDPVTFIGIPVLVVAVSLAACAVPAWRAAQIDPSTALRHE